MTGEVSVDGDGPRKVPLRIKIYQNTGDVVVVVRGMVIDSVVLLLVEVASKMTTTHSKVVDEFQNGRVVEKIIIREILLCFLGRVLSFEGKQEQRAGCSGSKNYRKIME